MATSSRSLNPNSVHLMFFAFLTLVLNFKPMLSFSLQSLIKIPNFDAAVALFGDARIINGDSSVQLTRATPSSSGLLVHTKPFRFVESNPRSPTSFSTDFTFSISPHNGDGLALIIAPSDFPSKLSRESSFGFSVENRFVGIEFDTSMDKNAGDLNANHVGIDLSTFISDKISNVSSVSLVLNSGIRLQSWIDYDASSKRIEVRLSKAGCPRPYDPLLVYHIDLLKMWDEEEVFIGLSSCSGNTEQISSVYSWNFRTRSVPKWLHSHPVNPMLDYNKVNKEKPFQRKRKYGTCIIAFVSGLAFLIACGALMALVVMSLRASFVDKDAMMIKPTGFRYEKIDLVVDNGYDGVKK